MDFNDYGDTNFNSKKKPLAGTAQANTNNVVGLGANQHPETALRQNPSLVGTVKQPAPFTPESPQPRIPLVKSTNASTSYTNTATTTPIASNNPVAMNAPKYDLGANAADKLVKIEPYNLAQNAPKLPPAPKLSPAPVATPVQAFGDKMASSSYVPKPESFIDKMGNGASYAPPVTPSIGQKLVGTGKSLVRGSVPALIAEGVNQANNYAIENDLKNGAFTDNSSRAQDLGTGIRMASKVIGATALDNPLLRNGRNQISNGINNNIVNPVLNGVKAAYDYGFTSPNELKTRNQPAPETPKLAQLRNIQVPPESAMDVKNMSLGQIANQQALANTPKQTSLPPATTGTQAAMSPVNSSNAITTALNTPNNYHDHLMQLSKDAGVTKFQPNLDYSADMNAMPRKLAGLPQASQLPTGGELGAGATKLAGTFNGANVYQNDNGSITLANGKTLNGNNGLAGGRDVLPNYAIDKLRNEALYNHDPNALDALVKINAGNQTRQQAADNLGFERDKFAKTNDLARQTQDANQRYNQGLIDNQNRQTALQESSAQWEREKPSQKLDDIQKNLHSALIDAAKSGDNDKFEQVANVFKKYHAITGESKKEKLKTSYEDAMGNKVENERLADSDKETSPEETRKIVEGIAQSITARDGSEFIGEDGKKYRMERGEKIPV